MRAIAGLGNPGPPYELTRHNLGFLAADALADRHGLTFENSRFNGLVAKGTVMAEGTSQAVVLFKPMAFMNRSGDSIAALMRFYKIAPEDLLAIHDELDLPLGQIRLKKGGGDGGHNGLRSITRSLGTPDYHRLRLGVGRPGGQRSPTDYLLSRFEDSEMESLGPWLERIGDIVAFFLVHGLSETQNRFHGTTFGNPPPPDAAN